jgi:hypothetical protein
MRTRRSKKITDEIELIEKAHDWFNFSKESIADSDRGCAMLLVAFLERHLEELLRSAFIQNKNVVAPLFQYPGPLSTFSAKIRIAYCLRLIHPYEYRDLTRINKIRNRFAHELHGLSFRKDKEISKLCQSLESRTVKGLDREGISNRWLFWLTAYSIASDIDNRTLDEETEKRIPAKPVFAQP